MPAMQSTCPAPAIPQRHLSALEFRLLNDFQHGFPLVARPFAEVAQRLGVDENTVLNGLQTLLHTGLISRIGAVFRPNVVGVSALAALSVPAWRLNEVAALVSAQPEVNHNYEREHHFNLWFVVTAASAHHLSETLLKIETVCDCGPALVLPLLEQFHIDLGFGLAPTATPDFQPSPLAQQRVAAIVLNEEERTFMAALEPGLAPISHPFAALGWAEGDALALLSRWVTTGVIKRFGVVVRHHELGFTANAMVVWDVPDGEVSQVGDRIALSNRVSLCYRRPRDLPRWPYNLFCMIHGRDRHDVELRIADLVNACGLQHYPQAILFSGQRFKQCGARYIAGGNPVRSPELAYGLD